VATVPGPARGSAPGRHGPTVESWAAGRALYLDNLKVILIAAIIALHAVASYVDEEFWAYAEMREVTLSPAVETAVLAMVVPFGLLMIPLLFLVAGLLTPPSVERKGTGAYARDRLLRLGVPFAVFVLLLWPLLMYPVHPAGESPDSYWTEFGGGAQSQWCIDAGPLWFVGVLLVFSLVYAGWVRVRPRRAVPGSRDVRAGHLLLLAAAVTVVTFMVRLVIPYDGDEYVIDLNLYEWPECIALFSLGVVAARRGWLTAVPDRLGRQCRTATLTAAGAFAVFVVVAAALGVEQDEVWGGWHWPAFVFALLASVLTVFGSVWLLGVAQRHLDRPLRWVGPVASRSAYGAFMVQGLPLIGLAVMLRPLPVPAEVKALLLAAGAVAGSFAIAWFLIRRVPGVARIL
jgi:hypothetical protein